MMPHNQNGFVTWKVLVPILIAMATATAGGGFAMFRAHASQPHAAAIHEREFNLLNKHLTEALGDIKTELLWIRTKLDQQREQQQ